MAHPERTHHIAWIDFGDVSHLGCTSCQPGQCPLMAALHLSYNAFSAMSRNGMSWESSWPSSADKAFEKVGLLLYPEA